MDFNAEQHLAITKVVVELTDLSRGSGLDNKRSRGGSRFKDNDMVFYKRDMHDIPSHHNRPLNVTPNIHNFDLRLQ